MLFYQKHTKHILKYHLVTAQPAFTVKTIDCMNQIGPRKGAYHPAVCYPHDWCLPSLSLCWSLCQKWELFFIKNGVKVNGQYCSNILLSQWMLVATNAKSTTILSFSKTVHRCRSCVQHRPTAAVQNCQLPFSWAMASLSVQSLNTLSTDL